MTLIRSKPVRHEKPAAPLRTTSSGAAVVPLAQFETAQDILCRRTRAPLAL
jgi:hypothetical protein